MKENKTAHRICMDKSKESGSQPPCTPTAEEIKADIDMINPDENTLDRG